MMSGGTLWKLTRKKLRAERNFGTLVLPLRNRAIFVVSDTFLFDSGRSPA